jgi:hypothetical protein
MDPEQIALAMAHARQLIADDPPPPSDPARRLATEAIVYALPTLPDTHGFVAIGELPDPARSRTAVVLLHPATGSVRLTWATDVAARSA